MGCDVCDAWRERVSVAGSSDGWSWLGFVPASPRGSHKEKENLQPAKPQLPRAPGPFMRIDREKEQGPSTCGPTKGHGGDTAASLLPVVKSSHQNPTLSARPPANRPDVSSHGAPQPAVKASVLGPGLKSQAEIKPPDADAKPGPQQVRRKCGQDSRTQTPGKQPVPVPIQTVQNPTKKARLSSFQTPTLRTQFPDVGTVRTLQPPFMATGLGSKQAPKATTETAATKTATLQPRVSLQPLPSSPFLGPAQDCPVLQHGPPIQVPGRPGSVTFMRGDKGQESPRFRTPPTSRPPENSASAQSPHGSREPEGRCPQVSRSVLYEDLRVTSSSEDSDSD
ncbi:PREDICTED: protein FAM90A27P-like [Colobus angolensis palliatus]|uniref:protein FAM90A27P-like n=1 Tax=Colobus angolensis palliatus TaxID=336983 RepID=UPI0005F4D1AF|nr:PREDICTED: protein FAM90A27P-like [Colobus angolensis palliatus]